MSRIVVKNLPKSITEDKLREIFSQKGLITDVQLKYTADGKSRQFCFIGFQNEDEAANAIDHFNNTRINTNKINVEQCVSLGETKSKKNARDKFENDNIDLKNKDEDKKKTKNKEKVTEEMLKKYKDDPMFQEFLEVNNASDVKKLLESTENDEDESDDNNEGEEEVPKQSEDEESGKLADKTISDKEYMEGLMQKTKRQKMEKKPKEKIDLFTVKLKNLPYNCKKKDIKGFFLPLVPYTIRLPRNIKSIAYVGFKEEKKFKKALLKDKSIIGGKQVSVLKYVKGGNEVNPQQNPKNDKWKSQEESLKNEESIGESGRIFLRNLSYTTTEDDIQKLFEKYGPLTEVNLPIDTTTRKLKGFGVVTFVMPEHAVKAYSELDGSILQGRMLHLLPGKAKETADDDDEEGSNYKQKKAKKLKSQSGSSHNWNSLFFGHDAVADVIADTYNTTKEAVIGPQGKGSAAVRLALGETQIVATTRKYLEDHGVFLDAFKEASLVPGALYSLEWYNFPAKEKKILPLLIEQARVPIRFAGGGLVNIDRQTITITQGKRSKTVIVVKNLPANTQSNEITNLFKPHGELARILFPPSSITALVEFIEPSEARKAFTKLAYSKFKNLPLYLEWAPENVLQASSRKIEANNNKKKETTQETEGKTLENNDYNESTNVEEAEEEEEVEPEPDTTIFVKNLHFNTTDNELRKHFESCGKIHYATVATKKDKNNPKSTLSMGYGFVRFILKSSADQALKILQQSNLEGKPLELKRSERTLQNDVKSTRKTSKATKQTGTKILVRNIPFQANKKEITEIFQTFGEIKALRLPKKMGPNANAHRGFAFVDYSTNSDAKKAFEALSQSTHLYGRRLVLEWASSEEGVDEIRKRTADHFHQSTEVKSKKSVFNLEET